MKVRGLGAPDCFAPFKEYCRKKSPRHFIAARSEDNIFRHRKKDGKLIDVDIDGALIPFHGRRTFLLSAQDITEKRRAEQRLRAQHPPTRALAEPSSLAEAAPRVF